MQRLGICGTSCTARVVFAFFVTLGLLSGGGVPSDSWAGAAVKPKRKSSSKKKPSSKKKSPSKKEIEKKIDKVVQKAVQGIAKPKVAPKPGEPVRPATGALKKIPAVFAKKAPESVKELTAIQQHVSQLLPKLTKATVGLRIGMAQGSGVIISKDGYVLTAGHVSGKPGRPVVLILPDGKQIKGITLGAVYRTDAGMVKITTPGEWPYCPMGDMTSAKSGDWCIAMGHPGGYKAGRRPVVRLGRVISSRSTVVQTDAALVGGDSGGPLFDMHGRVIGINSRIGPMMTMNFHVPISVFSEHWGTMAQSKVLGSRPMGQQQPTNKAVIGLQGEDHAKGCRVTVITPGLPADKAGLKSNDVITSLDEKKVTNFMGLVRLLSKKKVGDTVQVEILRDGKAMTIKATLVKRQ